jgi:PAS domain S-box-containing protein
MARQGVVATGQPAGGIEYRVLHANGSLLWHTSHIIPVRQSDGQIIGYVGVAHDI